MTDPLKFEVRDPKAEAALKAMGDLLREHMPPGYGFSLWIFNFGPGGNLFYTSNADRSDVFKMIREFLEKYEPQ
jgi:hypothetical protein